ncbi:ribonucleotide-diphosphate reductase subunit RNR4 NDAI_0D01950 [Naumovozyma dairenensis CBS 421]|uniref:Uncharacterized protein n=1 Tax=Naumovozyma dairenensis (strain ATCC 10597 / BCRC 20456 / CBS 421 / NBRC 0211 / NRRL Y-12639) TaxID=1071378 RepID=G0W9P8_NAUDC|nr:hypothetical protein NDAI_0D01950 [Naumovozyma dairenensis CBS 421]CCD24509.1 hypothetical protein NDAI_0D01950 [Naumovozyma dairenensis CBS 421]
MSNAAQSLEAHQLFLKNFEAERTAMKETEKDEILLMENSRRFVMFPIKYHEIWAAYKKVEAAFWTAEEIELEKDVKDFSKLNDDQKEFIARVLAYLTVSEDIINKHLVEKFSAELQNPEGKSLYGFQIMMENIYDEVYSMIVDALYNGPENVPYFKQVPSTVQHQEKAAFIQRWIHNPDSLYGERLVALSAKEGIFFSGVYAALGWLGNTAGFPGISTANKFICRDKGAYADFGCLLFAHLKTKPDAKIVEKIITEAVDIELDVMNKAFEVEKFGVDPALIKQYVQFIADSLLSSFGNDKVYNVTNPFEFMAGATQIGKSNFFEKKVSDFTKVTTADKANKSAESIKFNESF